MNSSIKKENIVLESFFFYISNKIPLGVWDNEGNVKVLTSVSPPQAKYGPRYTLWVETLIEIIEIFVKFCKDRHTPSCV